MNEKGLNKAMSANRVLTLSPQTRADAENHVASVKWGGFLSSLGLRKPV